jgi:hypothetical protein
MRSRRSAAVPDGARSRRSAAVSNEAHSCRALLSPTKRAADGAPQMERRRLQRNPQHYCVLLFPTERSAKGMLPFLTKRAADAAQPSQTKRAAN